MADKIVAEYIVKTDKAIKNLDRLEKEVKDLSKQGKKAAKDIEGNFKKTSSSLVSQFSKVGAALGVAFATTQLVAFGKEAVVLAGKAEGIERAFQKLNNPNLLNDLRKATRGTVADIELMQAAVKAKNFKIPLEQLAGFFKFATNRAIETGESVDYLVDSIINGIGRKSSLVLDNLGISATELQEEMKKVGDFGQAAGNIIARELEKAGDVADTTAIKLAQLNVIGQNLQVELGEALINLGIGFAYLAGQTEEIDVNLTGAEKAAKSLAKTFSDDVAGAVDRMVIKNQELLDSQIRIAELEEKRGFQNSRKAIANINEAIEKEKERQEFLREYIKQLKLIYDASIKVDEAQVEAIKNLKFYNDLIAELQTKQKDANTTRAEVRQLEDDINEAIRQRLILLGRLREVGGASMEEIESIASIELLAQQELTDEIISDQERRNKEIEELIKERNETAERLAQERSEREIAIASQYVGAVSSLLSSLSALQSQLAQQELQELNSQLEAGAVTREEYEVKRKQILSQQAEDQKAFAVFDASINGALAIVNAFAEGGPVLAAIVAAAVAAEVAAIVAAPLPQFAEGGFVDSKGNIHGRSHAQGGVKIEAQGGEFIVKDTIARENASFLEEFNAGRGQDWINKNMVYPAIQNVLDNGLESSSGRWGDMNAVLKDHNIIASQDRMRQSMTHGFKYLAKELKPNNRRRRGGYDSI